MLLKIEVMLQNKLWRASEKIKEFMTDEEGDTNVISIIVVLVIVLGLAIVFKNKLKLLVDTLWTSVTGKASEATTW